MAKKKRSEDSSSSNAPTAVLTPRDKKTVGHITNLADGVAEAAKKKKDPHLDIPARTLSNVRYNNSARIIEMGKGTNRRELFNLSQAKAYMQTLLVAKGTKALIDQGKTTSIRSLFYMLKHTIEGTKEETFDVQDDCDPIIEDLEVTLGSLREELHLYAKNAGAMVGPLTLTDSGDVIDCSHMGSGGYSVPSIAEPDVVQFGKHRAEFILMVEKDAVWRRFNEDKFWKTHNCILIHGGGQPPRGVRRMIHRMHNELTYRGKKLPVYCLLDNDPWGYYIYSVVKQGSINLAHESKRMAIPDARYLGIRSGDFEACELTSSVQIKLNEQDIKRAKQIAEYPWFKKKKDWQREINKMLANGFKLEVEALASKGISYATDTYVPERLKAGDWLADGE